MSMEMPWLDFRRSIDNQNGRHLATKFFFFRCIFFQVFKVCVRPEVRIWRPRKRNNLKNNYFYLNLSMNMEMTW